MRERGGVRARATSTAIAIPHPPAALRRVPPSPACGRGAWCAHSTSIFSSRTRSGPLMPKRADIRSILIIGAGPIVIGQACEFDYSGAQACKALKEEGYRVILVNSNPATIMTD